MKRFLIIVSAIISLIGCSGLQITDSSTHKLLSYAAGKAMAIGINEVRPEVDADLTNAWVSMMESNAGNENVNPLEMVSFYNNCLLIITGHDFDKYGLIGDLSMLLTVFGAEIGVDGKMTMINPVPLAILDTFAIGYANGRAVARR